jgi:integrase
MFYLPDFSNAPNLPFCRAFGVISPRCALPGDQPAPGLVRDSASAAGGTPGRADDRGAVCGGLAGVRKTSTIYRRLSSISVVHQLAGFASPTRDAAVQAVWKGTQRTKGTAPAKKKSARTTVIATLVAPLGTSLGEVRDRALLLMGFAGALRRSELVALDIDDVTEDDDGLVVTIRCSKGDQKARGDIRGLPYGSRPATCPVQAWRAGRDCR